MCLLSRWDLKNKESPYALSIQNKLSFRMLNVKI
uniref:Uncharacterized protein n=1 Tax=Arundo donax TaxID=35708 RepID=A0A0A8YEX9_ARUDO